MHHVDRLEEKNNPAAGNGWDRMSDCAAHCVLEAPPKSLRTPTSALLEQLKHDVPGNRVTFGWLFDYLSAQSPEALILFLALIGVLPGVSLLVGLLLALLSLAMLRARRDRVLPSFIAAQRFSSSSLVHAIDRTVPLFRWSERYVRPRDRALAVQLRPFAAVAILCLSVTLLVPLPLSNVIPSLVIGFIAFASIESDGLLLSVSIAMALVSLAITSATIWVTLGVAGLAIG
jgi:hypothetical protein